MKRVLWLSVTSLLLSSLTCMATDEPDLRLVGGTSNCNGILEMRHQGEWRPVGGLSFWNLKSSSIVCKQLDCGTTVSTKKSSDYPSKSVWKMTAACVGSESSLRECLKMENSENTSYFRVEIICAESVRLVNGPSSCSGRVEVKSNQSWVSVCEGDFDQQDAEVVCRQLGCGAPPVLKEVLYVEANAPLWTKEFQCEGNESVLLDCRTSDSTRTTCSSDKTVGLTCSEPEQPVRLVGGVGRCAGRLEMKYQGEWRRADEGSDWNLKAASVVCRQLDCGSALSTKWGPSSSYGSVWYIESDCVGSESSLRECVTTTGDTSGFGIEVICSESVRLVNGTSMCSGRVEVKSNQSWVSVCEGDFDQQDAKVVCRELGCRAPSVFQGALYGEGNSPMLAEEFQCDGSESVLRDCGTSDSARKTCSPDKTVGLTCSEPDDVRLVGGTSSCAGNLEMKHQGEWRHVTTVYNLKTASVVCRQLGCGSTVSSELRYGSTKVPVWLVTNTCFGSEYSVRECMTLGSVSSHWTLEVICSEPERLVNGPAESVRLVNGTSMCSGRVEVKSDESWVSVCGSDFDQQDAEVVCRQLGCGPPSVLRGKLYGEVKAPMWTKEFWCEGNESVLLDCRTSNSPRNTCSNDTTVELTCSASEPPTIVPELSCFTDDGRNYRGEVARTISGKTCQRWSAQTPHKHTLMPENNPHKGLDSNYCRNPDNSRMPWCYTTDSEIRWEYCQVPSCDVAPGPELTCYTGDGRNYRGEVVRTISGKTCQRWSAQTPHKHTRTPENHPHRGLVNNYCRNPDNERMPWCYTTDSETRWEYCPVPLCGVAPGPEVTCYTGDGVNYRGEVARTISGKTCQRWSAQTPHKHTRTPENHLHKGLDSNFCRNPDNEWMPWCYTTDSQTRWEFCPVPRCDGAPEPELTCYNGDGRNYRGEVARTISGKTCQRWSAQRPHKHDRTPENNLHKGLDSNYCRNPDGEKSPWCYTTDSETRWEYCSVPTCDDAPEPEVTCYTGDGVNYRGEVARAISGKTCQRWSAQTPHQHTRTPENHLHKGLDSNFCRNPDNEWMPWCYTTDSQTRWEFCPVPRCGGAPEPELTCYTGDGRNYRGEVARTISGKTCQRWSAQRPHKHDRTPENNLHKGLDSNYCRNPDGEKSPWCYTTDSETRWEYCSVPTCDDAPEPEVTCYTGDGVNYRGEVARAISGKTCQRWSAQTPHQHTRTPENHLHKGLDSNFCRNPDNEWMPWCYTTDSQTRWEFCPVPRCGGAPEPELTCYTGDGRNYRGEVARTISGKTCQRWSAQRPHKHDRTPENNLHNGKSQKSCVTCRIWAVCPRTCAKLSRHQRGLDSNYCRNPDGEKSPWCYTTDSETRWEYCSVPTCDDAPEPATIVPELTCFTGDGINYRGEVARTISGKTCQRWSVQRPHEHDRTPENNLHKGLDNNYCRNPDNSRMPWCYTTDSETRWEYCPVPLCDVAPGPEPTCYAGDGRNYRGEVASTISGKTCQRWSAQTPHKHTRTPDNNRHRGLDGNYCRNPDSGRMPWCYTTDSQTRWEYCPVPLCDVAPGPELTCYTSDGRNYRGEVARTISGKTCQRWSAQTPHKHTRTPEDHLHKGLDSNYCRNPDSERMPWCYTTDSETRWDYCPVRRCDFEPELSCFTGNGRNYRGEVARTSSGKTCQRWTAQRPHKHVNTPEKNPNEGLDNNYCRNPDNELMPWCYTADSETRWEYCPVPRCDDAPEPELTCFTGNGRNYRGEDARTISGKTCQRWSAQAPHKHNHRPEKHLHKGLDNNYCRNPVNGKMPWCYTTDSETRWEYCQVPRCDVAP